MGVVMPIIKPNQGDIIMSTSSERLADHFVSYLFDQYRGSRHVRRVASWIGFLIRAIENIAGSTFRQNRQRQIMFEYKERQFKVKYNHNAALCVNISETPPLPSNW